VLLATVVTIGLVVTRPGATVTETGGPTGTAPATAAASPAPSGVDAWLVPPREAAGVPLAHVQGGAGASSGASVGHTTVGPVRVDVESAAATRQTIYRYGPAGDPATLDLARDPAVRITAESATKILAASIVMPPTLSVNQLPNGWQTLEIGEVCAAGGAKQIVSPLVVTFTPCRHIALAWIGDFTVAVDATPGTDLTGVLTSLQLGSLDELVQHLQGTAGLDDLRIQGTAPITAPSPPPTAPVPDTPLCRAWSDVLARAQQGGPENDPALLDAMRHTADLAPPELAADLRQLAQQWNTTGPPPPESGQLMATVMNLAGDLCGGIHSAVPSSQPDQSPSPATTPNTLSKTDQATIPDVIQRQIASGWQPYAGDDVLHPAAPGASKPQGYLKMSDSASTPGKLPVYDNPNGKVIGFAYSQLGFVSLADDAAFDAHAERTSRFGCDQFVDNTCRIAGSGGG
jgi:hypothetical protein